jgi:hypothetical protein
MNAADPSDEIRARLQVAIIRLEAYARSSGSLRSELLDILVAIGLAEHELEAAKALARHAFRVP